MLAFSLKSALRLTETGHARRGVGTQSVLLLIYAPLFGISLLFGVGFDPARVGDLFGRGSCPEIRRGFSTRVNSSKEFWIFSALNRAGDFIGGFLICE